MGSIHWLVKLPQRKELKNANDRIETGKIIHVQLTFWDIVILWVRDEASLDSLKNHAISPFRDTLWAHKTSMVAASEKKPILKRITSRGIFAVQANEDPTEEYRIMVYPVGIGYGLTIYDVSEEQAEKLSTCLDFGDVHQQGEQINEMDKQTQKTSEIHVGEPVLV